MQTHAHQVLFTDTPAAPPTGYVASAMATVDEAFGERVRRWDLAQGAAFVAEHHGPEAAWAFGVLRPFAYKGDLLKLCLLHHLGGWVVDAGVRLLGPLDHVTADDPDLVLFRSTGPWDTAWNCSLALAYARPGHPVFADAIDRIVAGCRDQRYGHNPLAVTMSPFGRSLAARDVVDRVRLGTVVDVTGRSFARAYDLPGSGLVAARKPAGTAAGDVVSVGLRGGNDYVRLWQDRQVYGPEPPPDGPDAAWHARSAWRRAGRVTRRRTRGLRRVAGRARRALRGRRPR